MYISIDMEELRFLYKHESLEVVADLIFIAGKISSCDVGSCGNPHMFSEMTEMEKGKLFKNTTGQNPPFTAYQLTMALVELTNKFESTPAAPWFARGQADYLEGKYPEGVPAGYVFVDGSSRPSKGQIPLFSPLAVTAEEVAQAIRTRATASVKPAPLVQPAPAPKPAVKAQRAGSSKPTIWKVADEFWVKSGSSKVKEELLKLRITIMQSLEAEYGIKRTTSSNELGNWMKNKLA